MAGGAAGTRGAAGSGGAAGVGGARGARSCFAAGTVEPDVLGVKPCSDGNIQTVSVGRVRGDTRRRETPTARQLMAILEAVYRVESSRSDWFADVLASVGASLARGDWVSGVLYDVSTPIMHVDDMGGFDMPDGWMEVGRAAHRDPRFAGAIATSYRQTVCATLPELGVTIDANTAKTVQRELYAPRRVRSQTMINGLDGSGKGCCLFIFSRRHKRLTSGARQLFSRLATHLATGYRLQRRLAGQDSRGTPDIEAVLRPDGEIAHAETSARGVPARHARRVHVLAREECDARCRPRPRPCFDPGEGSWRLVGRWSITSNAAGDTSFSRGQMHLWATAPRPVDA